MKDKPWEGMNGWEKTWKVTQVIAGVAALVITGIAVFMGGGRSAGGEGTDHRVWTVGHGGKKDGSWSSSRHN